MNSNEPICWEDSTHKIETPRKGVSWVLGSLYDKLKKLQIRKVMGAFFEHGSTGPFMAIW